MAHRRDNDPARSGASGRTAVRQRSRVRMTAAKASGGGQHVLTGDLERARAALGEALQMVSL